jgi:3-dehydroquinate synthase
LTADSPVLDFKVKSIVHDYEVKFIDNSSAMLENEIKDGDVVIMDRKIIDLYPEIAGVVSKNNLLIDIEAHEKKKSYESLIPIINKLIKSGFRKNHRLIGVGGGITQDITAFIASIMYRGVDWIFFPTTLLAQGDSCIGSKTSINFGEFKNQVGGFYPPNKIYIDLNFLDTLSPADLQSGLGEMCHYFVVAGEKDFKQFKHDYKSAIADKSVLTKMVARSLTIKKSYIEIDEFDQNERQVFNYGHSFGHAIESLTNYEVPHGIAVSFGMDMANFISVKNKLLDSTVRIDIRELLQQIWQGYDIKHLNVNKFCGALAKDKKNVGNELRLILCKGCGKVFKTPVKNDDRLQNWLAEYFKKELN